MTPPKKPSRQDILRQQQQTIFVGREAHLDQFRYNLKLPPESWRFLFNVWGQGGVGKSTLLRQFRKLAEDAGCITALTTDSETSVPEAMGRLAEQLAQQGHPLEAFAERYKVYRQKKQELEADPEAPQGFSAFLGKSVAKAGLGLAKQIPGSGAVTPFLDEEGMTSQAGEWASYVARKLGNKDEVRLVNEPVEVLTPLFLQGLEQLAEQTSLVLFFDVYERTADFLDRWLREILESRYGDLPLNLIGVIAGREELDRNHWADYETAMIRIPLNPFTEVEAIQYLSRKDISNPKVIDVILRLSGCLPLLVATLAVESPNDPTQIGDPSGTAVERFLKWVDNPKHRQVALDAALPRSLNQDVIAVLHGEENADEFFNWLRELPFVEQRLNGWVYHDIVRSQMLRQKRFISPKNWSDLHSKLADYYDALRNDLLVEEQRQWRDTTWRNYSLGVIYYRLCQAPQKYLSIALNEFLAALKVRRKFAQQYAQAILQAGKDAEMKEIERWGERLSDGLTAYGQKFYEVAAEMFTSLLNETFIEAKFRSVALAELAKIHDLTDQYSKALEEHTEAIRLDPEDAQYWANRGISYRSMKCHEEALQDFNHAVKLDSKNARILAQRSITYRLMKSYGESLKDCNCAIELDPQDAWVIIRRGMTHHSMGLYQEALQDFNRAIEIDSDDMWAFFQRGRTYYAIYCYEDALKDFHRAIELDPKYALLMTHRGKVYRSAQRYEKALQDFNWAIELDQKLTWAIRERGEIYLILGQYSKALEDFNCAIELDVNNDWRLYSRALTYLALNQSDSAKADFDRAIQLAQQKYDQDPTDWNNTFNLALYHLASGNLEQMKHFYQDALNRGAPQARIQTAIQDLEDLLRVFPGHEWAQKAKAVLEKHMRDEK